MSLAKKSMTALVTATAIAGCSLAMSSTASAWSYHRPYHHHYRLGYYGGSYGYFNSPAYRRVPIYNAHDAHRLDRQLVGTLSR
jgi:hypothetical protein